MKKIILFISLLFLVYSSLAQNHIKVIQNVLNKEFENINNEIVIFKTYGNTNLIEFLNNKNKILNKGEHEFDNLIDCLNKTNFKTIFADGQIKDFKQQLSNDNFIYLLELPNRIKHECFKSKLFKENLKRGLPPDNGIYYFLVSNLIVSKNSEYVLFEYSKGISGSMTGGIKIYKKESDNNYVLLCEVNGWME